MNDQPGELPHPRDALPFLDTCPVCGYRTVCDEHDTCVVCAWQDDYAQRLDPDSEGANGSMTLRLGQYYWKTIGVSSPYRWRSGHLPSPRPEDFNHDWRPLPELPQEAMDELLKPEYEMISYRACDDDGVIGEIWRSSFGPYAFACPICGFGYWGTPVLEPAAELNPQPRPDSADRRSNWSCRCCGNLFGVYIPRRFSTYREKRIEWLDRVGWCLQALNQLRDHLGLSEGDLRREAAKVVRNNKPS